MKYTKIVATVGPATDSEKLIREMLEAGVNVFRFNMKHADIAWHEQNIKKVRQASEKTGIQSGVLVDLQGPEIRIATPNGEELLVKKGDEVIFTDQNFTANNAIHVPHGFPTADMRLGDAILIDDGLQEFRVTRRNGNKVYAKAMADYQILNKKGLNLPEKKVDLPSLTKKDLDRLDMAKKVNVDFVALSFVRSKKDIDALRKQMDRRKMQALIVSKIECRAALDNIDEIIEASDGMMVARGDLGVEVPFEELAYWQAELVRKCRIFNTPVIVATQMLESMRQTPRPTRAEVTDVATAVLQGSDAVMLSGETAFGSYPIESVRAMARIAKFNEGKAHSIHKDISKESDSELVVDAASNMLRSGHGPDIDAIVVFTNTGKTARVIASYRPTMPIIAVTDNKNALGELTLSYGVIPFYSKFPFGAFQVPEEIVSSLVKKKLLKRGNRILVIHGQHWRTPGQTNSLVLHRV